MQAAGRCGRPRAILRRIVPPLSAVAARPFQRIPTSALPGPRRPLHAPAQALACTAGTADVRGVFRLLLHLVSRPGGRAHPRTSTAAVCAVLRRHGRDRSRRGPDPQQWRGKTAVRSQRCRGWCDAPSRRPEILRAEPGFSLHHRDDDAPMRPRRAGQRHPRRPSPGGAAVRRCAVYDAPAFTPPRARPRNRCVHAAVPRWHNGGPRRHVRRAAWTHPARRRTRRIPCVRATPAGVDRRGP